MLAGQLFFLAKGEYNEEVRVDSWDFDPSELFPGVFAEHFSNNFNVLARDGILCEPGVLPVDIDADCVIFFDLYLLWELQLAADAVLFVYSLNLKWDIFDPAQLGVIEAFLRELRHGYLNYQPRNFAFKGLLDFDLLEQVARNNLRESIFVRRVFSLGSAGAAIGCRRCRYFVLSSSLGNLRLIIFFVVLVAHHLYNQSDNEGFLDSNINRQASVFRI